MRVIAGRWRGRALVAPAGAATRPTADRVRETLFSMLASRLGSFEGRAVADLFAGSGALGIEALSRGAASCLFVDSDRAAVDAIRTNLQRLGATDASVRHAAAERPGAGGPFDLVLADPPYASGLAVCALDALPLAPGAVIAVETGRGEATPPPAGFVLLAEREVARARLTLLRRG